jgi:hypothetical protein
VAITLKGIVQSKPQLPDKEQGQIAFFLYRDKTYDEISCVSSNCYGASTKWKRGDKLVLFGKWECGLISGQPLPLFIFNSASHLAD